MRCGESEPEQQADGAPAAPPGGRARGQAAASFRCTGYGWHLFVIAAGSGISLCGRLDERVGDSVCDGVAGRCPHLTARSP